MALSAAPSPTRTFPTTEDAIACHKKLTAPYLEMGGVVADFARKQIEHCERSFREYEARTGSVHYEVFSMRFPPNLVRARDDKGPTLIGPRGWGGKEPSSTGEFVAQVVNTLNLKYYNNRVENRPIAEFIEEAFYGGIGGINNDTREDHPIVLALRRGDEVDCWEQVADLGVVREDHLLCLRPVSTKVLAQTEVLVSGQHTFGKVAGSEECFDNIENLNNLGVWGDPQGVTYLATHNIDYFTVPKSESHFVRLSVDTQMLLKQRNVFCDPEALHYTREFGVSFLIFGGIPVSAIRSIEGVSPAEWLRQYDRLRW